ncbi:DgyrCDS7092 [Dimorphilus gyrociliatus]|uniref:DgyrCDS7092 n=1 Tax=Dimorphilus gyrociliatus TaxID=2664684 RepID=A0A7I8VRQ9_9ANNE|nr:DgyrCDS7092 [Dimorphilus gyrociliatus]
MVSFSILNGARVVVHAPGTTAHPEAEGFDASPGLTVRIGVKARENVRISHPWGNCTDETARIKKYTLLSCQNECIQKRIMEKCECVDNSLPHSNTSKLPFCYQLPSEWLNRPHCSNVTIAKMMTIEDDCHEIINSWYSRLQCVTDVYHNMTIKDPDAIDSCQCYPPCADILYDASYSISMFPPKSADNTLFFSKVDDFINTKLPYDKKRIIKEKVEEHLKVDDVSAYANSSVQDSKNRTISEQYLKYVADKYFTRITIYIADSNVIRTVESPDYEAIRLISDIGGQLG